MDYIETRPPLSEPDIKNLITTIESVKTPTIDGVVLSNLVRVCYECALRKRELIGLSIKDVAKKGSVGDIMKVGEDKAMLSNDAKQILQNHIDYLKRNGYRLYPTYPLFPTKKNERYNGRLLDNHLKKAKDIGT
jgi:integrase